MKSQTVFWLNLLQMHEIQEPFHHHVTDLLFLKSSAWEKRVHGLNIIRLLSSISTAQQLYQKTDLYRSPDDLKHSKMLMNVCVFGKFK